MPDLNANDLDAASKIIAGTARSMGVDVARLMASKRSKRYREANEKVDRDHAVHARRGHRAAQGDRRHQVRRDRRAPHPPRRERPPRRGAAPRHPGASERPRQGRDDRRLRRGRRPPAPPRRPAPTTSARQDLAAKVEEGWTDFDVAISTPALMGPVVSKLGRVLGPQGKMPNPKVGTVTDDIAQGRRRGEVGQDRVPHRPPGDRPPRDRQGQLRRARAARELRRGDRRDRPRQAGRLQGPLHALGRRSTTTMGPGIQVDPGFTGEAEIMGTQEGASRRGRGRARTRLGRRGASLHSPAHNPALRRQLAGLAP